MHITDFTLIPPVSYYFSVFIFFYILCKYACFHLQSNLLLIHINTGKDSSVLFYFLNTLKCGNSPDHKDTHFPSNIHSKITLLDITI